MAKKRKVAGQAKYVAVPTRRRHERFNTPLLKQAGQEILRTDNAARWRQARRHVAACHFRDR